MGSYMIFHGLHAHELPFRFEEIGKISEIHFRFN